MAFSIYQPNALDRSEFAGTRSGTWEPAADQAFETIEEAREAIAILQNEQAWGTLAVFEDDSRYPMLGEIYEPSDSPADETQCAYCDAFIATTEEPVPSATDDEAWAALAAEHAAGCEWIVTRAHNR